MTDIILDLIDSMRVRSTAYIAKNLSAPWGVHIDEHPSLARFHLVISGSTWIGIPGSSQAEKLNKGDIAIIPEGRAHAYFDEETRPAKTVKAYPTAESSPRFELFDKESEDTHLLCGYFEFSEYTPQMIISRLPNLLIGRRNTANMAKKFDLIVNLAAEELSNAEPVSQISLNRLTEMLCVYTIQGWLQQALTEDEQLRVLADPRIKLVLDEIHSNPNAKWTIDSLANLFGQSRATFTSQFKAATGDSPMSYVRRWRLKLACRMLEDSNLSIDEVAYKSGYADTNAFNRAFKREVGASPGAFKRIAHA